jgi:ribosomal protein L22
MTEEPENVEETDPLTPEGDPSAEPHASSAEESPSDDATDAAPESEADGDAEPEAEEADEAVEEPVAEADDDDDSDANESLDEADEGSGDGEGSADVEAEAEAEAGAPAKARRGVRRRGAAKEEAEAEKPAAAPRRSRGRRDPNLPAPVVRAQAKYVRSSARKARLVCDHIRGKSVEEARAILAHTPRAVAKDWSKLLESAVANAEHNHELVGEDLYIKAVHADEGPTIKRFRPRAMGRATKIRKRTAHLTILLTPKD